MKVAAQCGRLSQATKQDPQPSASKLSETQSSALHRALWILLLSSLLLATPQGRQPERQKRPAGVDLRAAGGRLGPGDHRMGCDAPAVVLGQGHLTENLIGTL